MYKMLRTALYALTVFFPVFVAMGQVTTGIYPNGTFDNHGLDTINVANLNAHFAIPILNKAGRGKSFTYAMGYDSSVWMPVDISGVRTWQPALNWGFLGATEAATGYVTEIDLSAPCPHTTGGYQASIGGVVYHDQWGAPHPFGGVISYTNAACGGPISSGSLDTTASDGSGYKLVGSTWATYAAGEIISPNNSVLQVPVGSTVGFSSTTDSNGNEISVNSSGQFTDTTGSVVLTTAGGAPSPETFTYKDTSGNPQTVTLNYATYTVQTAFGCSGIGEYGPTSTSLVSSMQFPDGSTYTFSYEPTPGVSGKVTGRLASVELPQGGTISYTYSGGSNGIECADGSTAGLTRSMTASAGSAASTWTYTRTITGTYSAQTAVVDGIGNHKIYTFVQSPSLAGEAYPNAYYETSRTLYEGVASGTPVLARNTCYNGAASPCTTGTFTLPASQIDTYETLNGIETHGTTTKFNTSGTETELDIYDYGSTARGSLLRKEVWTYGGDVATLPTEDDVYDGSGNQTGKTVYAYDGTTPITSSGVPQHVAVYAPRGNLTTTTAYANSTTSYTSTATYEDTGSILTSVSPTGTTTLTYDTSFVYNTGATLPTPSSGVALSASEMFDTTDTGLPLTTTDANSQITTFTTYDSMLRPTEVQYPDGGETTLSYSPTQLGQHTYQSTSVYSDIETQYDGYARPSRTAVANGQSGDPYYQTDTCYDGNGNVQFVSYPYQGTGWGTAKVCSGAGDSYSYDVLGRLTAVIRANGETRGYVYSGRATKLTDENSVQRISQIDGLGRNSIICEISSNSSMPSSGSPVSCGTDIAGTGFTTTYAYATTSSQPQTTITQGAQTRTFRSDWLGRPTLVQEPESGQTTYSYVYNSTGLQVTRTRPKANQTNPSVTTTTTTQYDTLGRPITITYSDGTPTKTFAYDASPGAGWSDLPQTNPKGRLSLATVSGAGTAYSYDAMGRVNYLDECLPSGCGTVSYNRLQHYIYDLAGNLFSSTDGNNVTSTYTVSPANEVLTLSSSLNNSTNPPSLVSSVLNGPNGPVSYHLGNGLSSVLGYDTLGRLSGGWVCSGSTSPSCTGGTMVYGFTNGLKGVQLTGSSDSVLNQGSSYGYDEFNRLTSRTVNTGTVQNFTYVYDRYGNRWQQNALQSGPAPQLSFNTTTNQISNNGYVYDAAGNLTNDGFHTYTYDAEGNITAVDGGSTATYVYNALNQRVRTVVGSATTEFVFNASGQRVSVWNGSTKTNLRGQYYWGTKPVAFYASSAAHFQHQDWLGTERVRTTYNSGVEGTFTSLPFGDAQGTASGTDLDPYHYASLDSDSETTTDHAQYRQYSSTQGRWMRPDPYGGSYDFSNPQSMNRYAYALNNPLSAVDPSGLDCIYAADDAPPPGSDFNTIQGGQSEIFIGGYAIVRGDCASDDDSGVFADGFVTFDSATVDPNTGQITSVNFAVTTFTADYSTSVSASQSPSPDVLTPSTDPVVIASQGQVAAPSNRNPNPPTAVWRPISSTCWDSTKAANTLGNWAKMDFGIALGVGTVGVLNPATSLTAKLAPEVGLVFGTTGGVEQLGAWGAGWLANQSCPQ